MARPCPSAPYAVTSLMRSLIGVIASDDAQAAQVVSRSAMAARIRPKSSAEGFDPVSKRSSEFEVKIRLFGQSTPEISPCD